MQRRSLSQVYVDCDLCGSRKYQQLIKNSHLSLVKCSECGLVYLNPRPSEEEVRKLYDKDFFLREYVELYKKDYISDKENIVRIGQRKLRVIEKIMKEKGRLLDVGCATGFFLELAKTGGWNTFGVEISQYATNYAQEKLKLNVFRGRLEEARYPDNYFNVVTAWFILEHHPSPTKFLKEIRRVLKEDGLLGISVPNIGGLFYKMFRKKWLKERALQYFHYYDFSLRTLSTLLEKTDFKIIKVKSEGRYTKNWPLGKMIGKLNLGNVLTVYAQKSFH